MDQQCVDPQTVQECIQEVVDCIRQFVEVLRAEFPPLAKAPSRAINHDQRDSSVLVPLLTRMVENGLCDQLRNVLHKLQEDLATEPPSFLSSSIAPSVFDKEYQSESLLQQVILPMLWSLSSCYQILDESLAQQQPPSTPTSNSPLVRRGDSNKTSNRPEPPRGLLSLQQYTDVACLLEFTVCISILPHLEPYILLPLEDRIRYHLPKSLAGRIPRASLVWGASQPQSKGLLGSTAITLTNLVLLDRFRPMLLPRHLADIYAALLQHEHNNTTVDSELTMQLSRVYTLLGLHSTPALDPLIATTVDPALQAKAFQTLLLQGIKTPAWLRQRVGPLLTQMACTNLSVIVQVFVPLQQGHGEVSSMASQRLGQTLAVSSATNLLHAQHLSQQIRFLLETLFFAAVAPNVKLGKDAPKAPPQATGIMQTIWAILYHWPTEILQKNLIEVWQRGLSSDNNQDDYQIHKIVRQIGCLCAFVPPPATQPWRILQHFFHRPMGNDTPCPSIMAMLLRIASMQNTLVHRQIDQEARQALYCLYQATPASNAVCSPLTSGLALLATACVDGVATNPWDLHGYSYKFILSDDQRPDPAKQTPNQTENPHRENLEKIRIEQHISTDATNLHELIDSITRRATVILETCLVDRSPEGAMSPVPGLASMIFRLLLKLYLSGSRSQSHPTAPMIHWTHQLATIVFLPYLCEKCSTEELLFGSGSSSDALGLLHSLKLLLTSALQRFVLPQKNDSSIFYAASTNQDGETLPTECDDTKMVQYLNSLVPTDYDDTQNAAVLRNNWITILQPDDQMENCLSIVSIVLSLLIALLELGNKSRSSAEEEAIQGYLPVLSTCAEFGNQSDYRYSLLSTQSTNAGISDMASYAMALIASRRAEPQQTRQPIAISTEDKVRAIIDDARQDLESSQPPIRARAMVSLGRLARGYLGILSPDESKPKLVVDWDTAAASDDKLTDFTIRQVLELSLMALSDNESYVYLAAIQTIVAIGDLRPKQIIPKLAAALVNGQREAESSISISNEQRIKLAEALMFIIRRRAAPADYLAQLLSIIVFGGSFNKIGISRNTTSDENRRLFALETDKYFRAMESQEEDPGSSLNEARLEHWKEQDLRLKAGGPVYVLEENDLVRSARLSVLAELVSVSPPSILAQHCRLLMRLATDVLRHDGSRTACRAAALLARQFYGCLNRESEESGSCKDSSLPLAVTVVTLADDETILATILGDYANNRGMYPPDPATTARCQEALQLRDEAGDVLIAARLLEAQYKKLSIYPTMLTSMVKERRPIAEINKLETLE